MYLRVGRLNEVFDFFERTVNGVGGDRLLYNDYKRLRSILKAGTCSECKENPYDSDRDVLLMYDNKISKYILECHHCSNQLVITSEYLNDLLKAAEEGESLTSIKVKWVDRKTNKAIQDIVKLEEEIGSYSKNKDKKENDNMLNGNKLFKGFEFGAVTGDADVRVSHLGLAIKNAEGIFVALDKESQSLTDVDFFDIDLDGMIYKMPVAHKDVKVGDVIIHNKTPMIVKEGGNNPKVIDPVAGEIKEIMPTKNMFGFNFFTKIVSLVDMSGANANADNPFGNLMPLMFMSGNKGGDNKGMLMAMMMMNQSGDMSNMMSNPMMMMALMGGDNNMGDILPMMMMMGNNPFAPAKTEEVDN